MTSAMDTFKSPDSYDTPEAFAKDVLPWIASVTGMKVLDDNLPILRPVGGTIIQEDEEGKADFMAGLYSPIPRPKIEFDVSGPAQWTRSILVHELTHYLQDMNGTLNFEDHRAAEQQAYSTQFTYLKFKEHVEPEAFGMTPERVHKAIFGEIPAIEDVPSDSIDI